MKAISLRMIEPVRVRTTDAPRYDDDAPGDVFPDLEANLGLLDPGDLSRMKAIRTPRGHWHRAAMLVHGALERAPITPH